jgi:hypothetical protein
MTGPSGMFSGLSTSATGGVPLLLLTAAEEADTTMTSSSARILTPYSNHQTDSSSVTGSVTGSTNAPSVTLTVEDLVLAEQAWNKRDETKGVPEFCSAESLLDFFWDCQASCVQGKTAVMESVEHFFSEEQAQKRADQREIFMKETRRAAKACEKGLRWSAHNCKKGVHQVFVAADAVLLQVFEKEESSKLDSSTRDSISLLETCTTDGDEEIVFSFTDGTTASTIKTKKDSVQPSANVKSDTAPAVEDKDPMHDIDEHAFKLLQEYVIPLDDLLKEDDECIEHRDDDVANVLSTGSGASSTDKIHGTMGRLGQDTRDQQEVVQEQASELETGVSVAARRKRFEQIVGLRQSVVKKSAPAPIVMSGTEETEAKSNCSSKKLIDLTGVHSSSELIDTSRLSRKKSVIDPFVPKEISPRSMFSKNHRSSSAGVIDLVYSSDSSSGGGLPSNPEAAIDLTMYDIEEGACYYE